MTFLKEFLTMILITCLAIAGLLLLAYPSGGDELHPIYRTFEGTTVPDYSRPVAAEKNGVLYETFEGTSVPRYDRPIGRAQKREENESLPHLSWPTPEPDFKVHY